MAIHTSAADQGQSTNHDRFQPPLDRERHLRYWLRCLRTFLPRQYTSNDSSRMTVGFFILSAIDLLSPPPAESSSTNASAADTVDAKQPPPQTKPPVPTPDERRQFREWVLSCQHPGGGFCGSPTHAPSRTQPRRPLGLERPDLHSSGGGCDPSGANIAATSFALLLLALLAEPDAPESAFRGVNRVATLRWLKQLQRPDGSFGELLFDLPTRGDVADAQRMVEGGRDMRFCLIAALIRWILRGDLREEEPGWVEDIDVEMLLRHIRLSQTFDGGLGESSMHESHAGYAYCAIAALSLLDRQQEGSTSSRPSDAIKNSGVDLTSLMQFLASRSFAYVDPPPVQPDEQEDDYFVQPPSLSRLSISDHPPCHVGFNGRCNKVADSCYCWWVTGALDMLGQKSILDPGPARRFMMEKTQHVIGGFGKHPGNPPDVYHSYLGLAALSLLGDPGLKALDAPVCASVDTVRKVEAARRGLLRRDAAAGAQWGGLGSAALVAMGESLAGKTVESLLSASG